MQLFCFSNLYCIKELVLSIKLDLQYKTCAVFICTVQTNNVDFSTTKSNGLFVFIFGFLILKTTVFNTHATLSLPKAFTLSFNICSAAAIRFESLALFQREFTLIYLHLRLKGTHVCTRRKTQLNQLDFVFVFPLIIYNAIFRLARSA